MQKIIPHLWFDTQAKEAVEFYVSIFDNSKITNDVTLRDTPSGDSESISFVLAGYSFMAISAGPFFKLNPAISFMLNFDPAQDDAAEEKLRTLWEKLAAGGKPLMPLQEYPFSKLYGWIEDKYGVTWQLLLVKPEREERPFIVPSLMFTKKVNGRAEEAADFYINTFKESRRGMAAPYPEGSAAGMEGKIMYSDFQLEGQWFAAMDGGQAHEFTFTEAISLKVSCDSQEEIDQYWERLSVVPESEQCGWLKDKFGVSWQITPSRMDEMMRDGSPEQIARLTQAFLKMKKLDIAALEAAYAGE